MVRTCKRCEAIATQDLVCSTELIEDKSRVLKKGQRYNAIPLTDLCDDCSEELFKMVKAFVKEFD